MLALMRDPQVPFDLRIDMAATAAPFVHARPEPVRKKGPDPLDLRDRLGGTGDLKFGSLEAKAGAEASGGVTPLDFLLGVMGDPAASPRQRVKAAAIAARYTHARAGAPEAPTVVVVEDKFDFKVDPEMARAERDDSVRERRLGKFKKGSAEGIAAKRELEKIRERRAERLALVKFPVGYTDDDLEADRKRLNELFSKRLSRKKLTPEEGAEEAHLAVRVANPEVKEFVPTFDWMRQYRESKLGVSALRESEMEWPMSRIAELEERFVVGETPLTAAEEDELNDQRYRYPKIAADVDRLDHSYRYWPRLETEIVDKEFAGKEIAEGVCLRWLEARRAASDKCEPLRDPRKMAIVTDLREGPHGRIHRLESFRFDEILTPEEADELEELHRRYPERAEKARKFVVRRLSEDRANGAYRRQLGIDPGPIEDGEWPRIWTLPADNARRRTPGHR
jgi:hypothetical protein